MAIFRSTYMTGVTVGLSLCFFVLLCYQYFTFYSVQHQGQVFQRHQLITDRCTETCGSDISLYKERIIRQGNAEVQVVINSSLSCAICVFNARLAVARTEEPNNPDYKRINHADPVRFLAHETPGVGDDFFTTMKYHCHALSLQLTWEPFVDSHWTKGILPIDKYFLFEFPPPNSCVQPSSSMNCIDNIENRQSSSKIPYDAFEKTFKVSADKVSGYPDFPLSIHMLRNGIVDANGMVYTGWTDIIPFQCHIRKADRVPEVKRIFAREVFVITYDSHHKHFDDMISLTRLVPYVQFLQQNEDIMIHVAREDMRERLEEFGLSRARIIKGYVESDILYIPQGGGCGWLPPFPVQLLKHFYSNLPQPFSIQPVIILAAKNDTKSFPQFQKVYLLMESIANDYGYHLHVHEKDLITPSDVTVEMFSRAELILSYNGTGLSNLFRSRSGINVVELLERKNPNPNHWTLSTLFGHEYTGLISTNKKDQNVIQVDVNYLKMLLRTMQY